MLSFPPARIAGKAGARSVRHASASATTNEYYPELASKLFLLAVRLRNATGADFSFINLSGGIGVDYRPEQPRCDIQTRTFFSSP